MSGRLYGPMPAMFLFPPLYTVKIIDTEKLVGDSFPLPEGILTYIRSIQDPQPVCSHADTVAILVIPLRMQGLEKNEHMASTRDDQSAANTLNYKAMDPEEVRLRLCIGKDLGPRGPEGKVLKVKRN